MKYKLLCVDIDGTLAKDDKSISKRNLESLKKRLKMESKLHWHLEEHLVLCIKYLKVLKLSH